MGCENQRPVSNRLSTVYFGHKSEGGEGRRENHRERKSEERWIDVVNDKSEVIGKDGELSDLSESDLSHSEESEKEVEASELVIATGEAGG